MQAVSKMVRELGLTAYLRESRIAKSLVRSALAIPLLPQRLMARGFQTLIAEANRRGLFGPLEPFFNYMTETWFSMPFLQSLSVYGLKHRTNNCAESANRLLRSKTGAHKPSVWHFLCKCFTTVVDHITVSSLSF